MNADNKPGKVLPFPLRVAAGLAVTATEQARWLPARVVGLPITVASRAVQTAMRVQQQVTTLAIKGDDALSAFKPAQESPPWATFDEDAVDEERPAPGGDGALRPINGVDAGAAAPASANVAPTRPAEPAEASGSLGSEAGEPEDPWLSEQRELGRTHADGEGDSDSRANPPAAFPNYDELTLPQLRARLRRFSLADLHELLDYERAHASRPDFTKMLARRIDTVRAEQ
jgi:hypothetical protein